MVRIKSVMVRRWSDNVRVAMDKQWSHPYLYGFPSLKVSIQTLTRKSEKFIEKFFGLDFWFLIFPPKIFLDLAASELVNNSRASRLLR